MQKQTEIFKYAYTLKYSSSGSPGGVCEFCAA